MSGASGIAAQNIRDDGPPGERVLARVIDNQPRGRLQWLTVQIPRWIDAQPGQFALLQAERSCCFLARAFSVADEARGAVSFLIDPIGQGTRELSLLSSGEAVWALGPLGSGFDLDAVLGDSRSVSSGAGPARSGRILLVAGGVGVAPFPLFLSRLAELVTARNISTEVVVLAGFRDADQAQALVSLETAIARYQESGFSCRLVVAAEDGSLGPPRKVTDLLEREMRPGDRVAACGPKTMLAAVWRISSTVSGTRTWFSLEANMACGVGSCHGCVVALADGSFARVCREGPVFAGEVVFSDSPEPIDSQGQRE